MERERMKILQLLAEEAIDTDEAVQLLEALNHKVNIEKSTDCENIREDAECENIGEDSDWDDVEENVQQFARSSQRFAEDFSERFHVAFKNVEPELDAAAKEVLGSVASLLDDVSQSLKDKSNETCDKDTPGGNLGE